MWGAHGTPDPHAEGTCSSSAPLNPVGHLFPRPTWCSGPGPLAVARLPRREHTCASCFPACVNGTCTVRVDVVYPKVGGGGEGRGYHTKGVGAPRDAQLGRSEGCLPEVKDTANNVLRLRPRSTAEAPEGRRRPCAILPAQRLGRAAVRQGAADPIRGTAWPARS